MESENSLRKRIRYVATNWDSSIPYGGKVYLSRKKKPDSWMVTFIEIFLLSLAVLLGYYSYYHLDYLYAHTIKFYAHLGYKVNLQFLHVKYYLKYRKPNIKLDKDILEEKVYPFIMKVPFIGLKKLRNKVILIQLII